MTMKTSKSEAKEQLRQRPNASTTSDKTAKVEDDDIIPEDLRAYKEKLEKETGKKYKYRTPRKELPSIEYMLAHGAPESQGKPKTWFDLVAFPLLMVVLFFISFTIFIHAPHEKSRRFGHQYRLPVLKKKMPMRPKDQPGAVPKKP